jgi:subtilisin family serine protease
LRTILGAAAVLVAASAWAGSKAELGKWIVVYKNAASVQAAGPTIAALGGRVTRQYQIIPGQAVEMSAAAAEALRRNPAVAYVEPDGIAYALGSWAGTAPAAVASGQVVPYGIDLVRAREAWSVTRGAGVRVAVLDTGIDSGHPDHGHLALLQSFVPNESVEDTVSGHGTHTSGTVGAEDNNIGVVGVAPEVHLMIGKVLSNAGSGSFSWIIAGIDWAVQNNANVISMSLGGTTGSSALEAAINNATAADVLVVAAAGNDGNSQPHYPAYYNNALAVGAVDQNKQRASFSCFGSWVDIAAPGVDTLSTVPRGMGQSANARWSGADHGANGIAGAALGSRTAAIVNCGLCQPADFAGKNLTGKISHCQRGTISFNDKVVNSQNAGAVGVIISNNVPGNFNGTLGPNITSPLVAVSVSQEDGATISDGLSGTLTVEADDYAKFSGTSMATPHVAGVAALVFSAASSGTVAVETVRNALVSTADPLPVPNQQIGNLVDALDAVRAVSP